MSEPKACMVGRIGLVYMDRPEADAGSVGSEEKWRLSPVFSQSQSGCSPKPYALPYAECHVQILVLDLSARASQGS